MVPKVLVKTGAMKRAREFLQKALMLKMLLYVTESWVIMEAMMKVLETFHHQINSILTWKIDRRIGE